MAGILRATTTAPARSSAATPVRTRRYALIEALGADPEADQERFERVLAEALERELIVDAAIAKSESERSTMWAPREDVFQMDRYRTVGSAST